MQDLSFISNMSDEDAYLFKRCVRRLLDTTFLVKDKEESSISLWLPNLTATT